MTNTLNFHHNPVSTYSHKVQYFLEEAGIPYKAHAVNLLDPAAKQELAKFNPFVKVPAIELNGFALGESTAIIRSLAQRYKTHSFYPANLEDRAQVDMLVDYCTAHVNRYLG